MKTRFFNIVLLALVLVLSLNLCAFANADTAGNYFSNTDEEKLADIDRDLYKVGQTVDVSSVKIGGSALLVGLDINIADSEIAGSLRSVERTMTVSNTKINGNITVVGQEFTFTNVTTGGAYIVGQNVNFSGEADAVSIIAANVTLGGTIHGDVEINAATVSLADDLNVEGKLTISSASEPSMPTNGKIESYDYSRNVQTSQGLAGAAVEQSVEEMAYEEDDTVSGVLDIAASFVPEESPAEKMAKFLVNCVILGLAICLVYGPKNIAKPAQTMLKKPGATFGLGLLALIVFPILILVFLFSAFTSYTAGLLAAIFTVICLFARTFVGASLAAALLKKYAKNSFLSNAWFDAFAGALIFALLSKVPYLGTIITLGSLLVALGCFVQYVISGLSSGKKAKSEPTAEVVETPAAE